MADRDPPQAATGLAAARAQLSPAARAELLQRLRGNAAPSSSIPRLAPGAPAPLSTSQARLWLIDQLLPGTAAYNIPVALRIRGALDTAALKRGLDELVRRHAILRSVFEAGPDGGHQRVLPALAIALPITDLRAAEPGATDALIHEVCGQPFDLARGPLLRARLAWLAPREHLLVLCFHHIACDGVSAAVAVRELGALYQAFVRGGASPLPPLPVQYADYAAWQRTEHAGAAHAAALARWQQLLDGAPPWLELGDTQVDASLASATASITIADDQVARLHALGRAEQATPFMVLLAAFQALLARHTGQRDLVIGTPISTRSRPELEALIGFFVNTLPLRARLPAGISFRGLLRTTREQVLTAFGLRDVPFEQILERLGLRAEAGRVPLSEVMFAYEEAVTAPAGDGLALEWQEVDTGTVHMDLVLRVRPVAGGLRVTAIYRRARFDPARITALLGHYQTLLASITEAPDAPLDRCAMLAPAERDRLLAWAAPGPAATAPRCLHALFEDAVDRAPEACAVICDGRALSYAALDTRANQLAHALIAGGVLRGQIVAVVLPRSERLVIALLAIWKAGAAYLPIDPDDPRRAQLISHAARVITDADFALDGQPSTRPAVETGPGGASPDDAAYIIFTSGSTGEAKGVVVEHAALCNQARWKLRAAELTPADRLLHAIPHTFDPSIWDFIGPLIAGASIVVTPPGAHRDPALLLALAAEHRATVLDVSLAMLQALLDAAEAQTYALAIRHIFCGGDAMPPEVPARAHRVLGARLFNQYGPTEATIDACAWPCDPAATGPVPIGRPIDGARVYLLDDALQLVPAGAIGELCIGGAGVARGYLGDDAQTAAKFVPDPFLEPLAGGRMYRTGDLGRHRPDGAIEFLGRRDHQVKIRGVRVELGEVEAKLAAHPGVREVVAVARRDGDQPARLVAYVVARPDHALTTRELRGFARGRLPDAMVPSAFVVLDALPVNANGKLDRGALPAPDQATREAYVAPRTDRERQVAAILAELLGLPRVGAFDQFLELGGHSLLAMRAAARLAEATGAAVPVRLLFEHATIAELAAAIDRHRDAPVSAIPPHDSAVAPLSHQQRFVWRMVQSPRGALDGNVPLAVRFTGALDADALDHALGQLIARHAILRTTFSPDGSLQHVQPATPFALPRVDLRDTGSPDSALAELARREAATPFDLTRDRLLRGPLVSLSDRDHALLLTTHRIAYDGASLHNLARELIALYVARTTGVAPVVPTLPIQYADYAAWQAAQPIDRDAERYWIDRLAGTPMSAPSRLVPSAAGARSEHALPTQLTADISALATSLGATPFMVLATAVQLALAAEHGSLDQPVWTPVGNRGLRELEPLVGRFVNLVALRPRLAATMTARDAIAELRTTTVDALAHQQHPFERLTRTPGLALPRVMLNQVDALLGALTLPGLTIAPLPVIEPSAEFELTITAQRGPTMILSAIYTADRDATSAAALLARIDRTLRAITAHPDHSLAELLSLPPEASR